MKPRLVVVGPLPPPYHGVTISTSLVLANRQLHAMFDVAHLDTSDRRSGRNLGKWDATNLSIGVRALIRLWRQVRAKAAIVYLPLSQNRAAFLRDSLLIHVAALHDCKVAVHLRGSEFRAFYEASPPLFQTWVRFTLRRVSSVAVMGESLRWIFEDLVAAERIVAIPNGTPDPGANGDISDGTRIVFLSNLRRRKGVVEAVEAAHLVIEQDTDARFLFVGEWEDDDLEKDLLARAACGNGRIQFRGSVTGAAKDRLLSSASIMLFPPQQPEGHPRVVIEALAAGLPVIATNRGAIAETIVDGESGFILPDANPTALAERILLLLRRPNLRARMSQAARARYLERFTQERADRLLADWLRTVADDNG